MAKRPNRNRSTLPPLTSDGPPSIQLATIVSADGEVLREPLVESADWKDPDDTGTAARMHGAKTVHGHRVAWQIARLHRTSPHEITEQHVKAAERFMNDWNIRNGPLRSQLGHGGGSGDSPIVNAAVRAGISLDAVKAALGTAGMLILTVVVINNRPITALAGALHVHRDRAFGRFAATVERLREHYQPPAKSSGPAPPMMAPPDVDDIPVNRLGRWRHSTAGTPQSVTLPADEV